MWVSMGALHLCAHWQACGWRPWRVGSWAPSCVTFWCAILPSSPSPRIRFRAAQRGGQRLLRRPGVWLPGGVGHHREHHLDPVSHAAAGAWELPCPTVVSLVSFAMTRRGRPACPLPPRVWLMRVCARCWRVVWLEQPSEYPYDSLLSKLQSLGLETTGCVSRVLFSCCPPGAPRSCVASSLGHINRHPALALKSCRASSVPVRCYLRLFL